MGAPDDFQAYLDAEVASISDLWRVEIAMQFHEDMWGVPLGPTLSMVHPPKLVGLAGLMSEMGERALLGDSVWLRPIDTTPAPFDLDAILRSMGPVDR